MTVFSWVHCSLFICKTKKPETNAFLVQLMRKPADYYTEFDGSHIAIWEAFWRLGKYSQGSLSAKICAHCRVLSFPPSESVVEYIVEQQHLSLTVSLIDNSKMPSVTALRTAWRTSLSNIWSYPVRIEVTLSLFANDILLYRPISHTDDFGGTVAHWNKQGLVR